MDPTGQDRTLVIASTEADAAVDAVAHHAPLAGALTNHVVTMLDGHDPIAGAAAANALPVVFGALAAVPAGGTLRLTRPR